MRQALLVVVLLAGCASSTESPKQQAIGGDYVAALPDGWDVVADRGSLILSSPASPRHTIVIRVSDLAGAGEQRESLSIIDATRTVVAAMPDARIDGERALKARLPATSFDLSFVPPGERTRYRRTHVVLVGAEHAIHVLETAPAGLDLEPGTVEAIVSSIREEG